MLQKLLSGLHFRVYTRGLLLPAMFLFSFMGLWQNQLMAQEEDSPMITFKTNKKIGDEIKLELTPIKVDEDEWAKITIEGVAEPWKKKSQYYTLTDQTVKITGPLAKAVFFNLQITDIEISNSQELISLWLNYNKLSKLDLSGCPNLTELACMQNNLTSLDLSPCKKLAIVTCNNNKLTTIKTDGATDLGELNCRYNEITTLDFTNNPHINRIIAYHNQITDGMPAFIESLPQLPEGADALLLLVDMKGDGNVCYQSDVTRAKERGWSIMAIDKGNKINYPGKDEEFYVTMKVNPKQIGENIVVSITSEDELTAEGLEGNLVSGIEEYKVIAETITIRGNITKLSCALCRITEIDVSHLRNLEELDCSFNELTSLSITRNLNLVGLDVMGNKLKTMRIGRNNHLEWINCSLNELTGLNFVYCNKLRQISCFLNKIDAMNFMAILKTLPIIADSKLGEIFYIETTHEKFQEHNKYSPKEIEYANSIGWKVFDYRKGQPVEIRIENPPVGDGVMKLTFDAEVGKVIPLEIFADEKSFVIEGLNGEVNEGYVEYTLASPEVTIRGNVKTLRCFSSLLTKLDASENNSLSILHAFDTKLETLDMSRNTNLKRVIVKGCKLDRMTFGNNPKIESISAHTNRLKTLQMPSEAPLLTYVDCFRNQLDKEAMGAVINGLPNLAATGQTGSILVFDSKSKTPDGNRCIPEMVEKAKSMGWKVIDYIGGENGENGVPYAGWTSVAEVEYDGVVVSPQPAAGFVEINHALRGAQVVLYTLSGEQICIEACDASGSLHLSLPNLPEGYYLLKVAEKTTRLAWFR